MDKEPFQLSQLGARFSSPLLHPMALAGLWDRWKSKDKSETKETFTIVTTEPSKFSAQFITACRSC